MKETAYAISALVLLAVVYIVSYYAMNTPTTTCKTS